MRGQTPVVGQIFSDRLKDVPVLLLRPVEWVHHESTRTEALAILWHPVCVAVSDGTLCFRGVEATARGPSRRWASQKWLCEVLDAPRARARVQIGEGTIGKKP